MTTTPTFATTLDHTFNQHDTSSIRRIPLIHDYNPYSLDPDYCFDPYWDTHVWNHYHLFLYHNFDKTTQVIEPDSSELDHVLNVTISNAYVDPWQRKCPVTHQLTSEPENEIYREGPQVSLATAVAARFVNILITRTGEPDYVPLTTNLGLKYKRRMLYFLLDFGELISDGLVDTGALSRSILEADLCKI